MPWWAVLLVTLALLALAAEVGFRIGRRGQGEDPRDRSGHSGLLIGAMLALLGLMLAFSFSIVEGRFAARKALVLEEANAIGTSYLRAALLPEPHRSELEELLRRYVELRLHPPTRRAMDESLARSAELHPALWAEVVAAGRLDPRSDVAALAIASVNQIIDLHEARVTVAVHQRLPGPILLTLYLVSLLSMIVLGFGAGLGRWRSLLPTLLFSAAVSIVVVLIVELDRPGARLVKVSQSALLDVRESLDDPRELATPPAASTRSLL